MAVVYAKVPSELQEVVLKQLRRDRLRANLLSFPLFALVISAIAILAAVSRGHALVALLRRLIGDGLSDGVFWGFIIATCVICGTAFSGFILLQRLRDCVLEEHLYCPVCQAVDSEDEGCCPVCRGSLTERASFFYTLDATEQKGLDRYGLVRYTPAPLLS